MDQWSIKSDEKSHTNSTTRNNITNKEGLVSSGEFRMQIGNDRTWIGMCHYFTYESGKSGNREYT